MFIAYLVPIAKALESRLTAENAGRASLERTSALPEPAARERAQALERPAPVASEEA